jgi:hypothetical protein
MEPVNVIGALPFIVQNPNLIGFILFILCFLPLLAYIMHQAGKQSERQQDFFNRSMDDAKNREERLGSLVNTTLSEQTRALTNINTTLVSMNQNLCDVKNRVDNIENIVGIEKRSDVA